MSQLDQDIRAAIALGISYGYYKAMTYDPGAARAVPPPKKRKRPQRRFTDQQAFSLWQSGLSDTMIARECGVSRQSIQKWRDQLELPMVSKNNVETQKYRLAYLPDGTCIVVQFDEL